MKRVLKAAGLTIAFFAAIAAFIGLGLYAPWVLIGAMIVFVFNVFYMTTR